MSLERALKYDPENYWVIQMMNSPEPSGVGVLSEIRCLSPLDVADALELSRLAGWNQTEADWRRLLSLSLDRCFCIEAEGRVVATTTLVTYGFDCAWVGMVLTHPDWRGRGCARRLLGHTLAIGRALGIVSVKLDATSQGRPLYESFGFRPEQYVERWERPGSGVFANSIHSCSLALDESAYGYSRRKLLESLCAENARTDDANGYVLTRPGAIRSYVGPCVAPDPNAARQLLTPILDAVPGSGWFWDLPVENHDARILASDLGFQPVRRLLRMSIGLPVREQVQNIYALAGLEFG